MNSRKKKLAILFRFYFSKENKKAGRTESQLQSKSTANNLSTGILQWRGFFCAVLNFKSSYEILNNSKCASDQLTAVPFQHSSPSCGTSSTLTFFVQVYTVLKKIK